MIFAAPILTAISIVYWLRKPCNMSSVFCGLEPYFCIILSISFRIAFSLVLQWDRSSSSFLSSTLIPYGGLIIGGGAFAFLSRYIVIVWYLWAEYGLLGPRLHWGSNFHAPRGSVFRIV